LESVSKNRTTSWTWRNHDEVCEQNTWQMVEGRNVAKRGDGALAPHLWVTASIYVANCDVYELFM
jgi:hypothetical protein